LDINFTALDFLLNHNHANKKMEIVVRLSRMSSLPYSICLLMPMQSYGMALFGAQGIGGRHRAESDRGSITIIDILVLAIDCRRARGRQLVI
jgi:hypothetical protein